METIHPSTPHNDCKPHCFFNVGVEVINFHDSIRARRPIFKGLIGHPGSVIFGPWHFTYSVVFLLSLLMLRCPVPPLQNPLTGKAQWVPAVEGGPTPGVSTEYLVTSLTFSRTFHCRSFYTGSRKHSRARYPISICGECKQTNYGVEFRKTVRMFAFCN
jgi:hypothetical protein